MLPYALCFFTYHLQVVSQIQSVPPLRDSGDFQRILTSVLGFFIPADECIPEVCTVNLMAADGVILAEIKIISE